jgi:Fe-S cluster assembly iron-binding protein IscA
MIEVTARATDLVTETFRTQEPSPIRIFVKMGGCGIRSLGVALEKPTEADGIFNIEGHTYIVDRKLLKQIAPIKMDADGICFQISGRGLYPPTGCGSCPSFCGAKGGKRCSGVCPTCEDPCPTGLRLKARRKLRQAQR